MSEILVGQFLFRRLKELGVETIFGVPGDYELALLDFPPQEGLAWIGTPNELVGAYAADGYARQKGFGAVVTTFGPGELSALCGLGGAYCEFVPVLHIVGYPSLRAQASGKILHHTLGDGSYQHYHKMSAELSCAAVVLKDPATAVAEIDRVLNAILLHSQPGYIGIPEDVVLSKIPLSSLDTKLPRALAPNDSTLEQKLISEILTRLSAAQSPILLIDGGAARHSWSPHADTLIDALNLPHYVTTLGKGAANETHPLFGGAYAGHGSPDHVIAAVERADCVLWLGNLPSDFNTGMFTEHVREGCLVVDFQRFAVDVGGVRYAVKTDLLLPRLAEAVRGDAGWQARKAVEPIARPRAGPSPVKEITHDYFWPRMMSYLQPGDLCISETGTAQFGLNVVDLPQGASCWTQAVYGSIGYAAGAAVGAAIAAKEAGTFKRLVLFTGEGSLQLTVQAFSILIRHGITPVVFVFNNKGYTVERYFHGFDSKYNDVPDWDYGALFRAFAPEIQTGTFKVQTAEELDSLLSKTEFQTATYPQLVDMALPYDDCPKLLKKVFDLRHPRAGAP